MPVIITEHSLKLFLVPFVYESNSDDRLDPGFVADELTILQRYLETEAPEKLDSMTVAVTLINWAALPDGQFFKQSLAILRQNLANLSSNET